MTNKNLRINLFKDFADAVRRDMAVEGHEVNHVKDDDHAAIMLYYKTRRYMIEPRPRGVLKATGFQHPPQYELGIQKLEQAIQNGTCLTPYRSKRIATATSSDDLFDYWQIHHFHLGSNQMNDGFVERTNELLFCRIEDEHAYFIKIASHDSSPWAKKELVEIIHENWPDTISYARLSSVSSLEGELNDDERKVLRRANAVTFLDMADGTIYIEPGIGRTMGGLHVNDLRAADDIHRFTETVEAQVTNEWPHIIENARRLGYFLKEPVSLLMVETIPHLHWDILDPESGYRFRQYLA